MFCKWTTHLHLADAFIQSDLQLHSGYTFFISMCVPWELNPQHFALLMQCSTTEPQEHRGITVPSQKRHKITFTDFFIYCSHLVERPAQLNPSSWILPHLQETAKNTSLPSLFDPLNSSALYYNFILSNLSSFYSKNTQTFDPLSIAYVFSNW